jgi:hypothetical protein
MVRRYLVVANKTLDSPPLFDLLFERAAAGPSTFFVLVPATRLSAQESAFFQTEHLRVWPGEHVGLSLARWRLQEALRRFAEGGLNVTGDVGDPNPLHAIRQTLASISVDEIIVSTLAVGVSHWIAMDLPARARREFEVPVTHVEAPSHFSAQAGNHPSNARGRHRS